MKIAIGIDIGGTNIKAVIVSEGGAVLASRKYPTPAAPKDKSKNAAENFTGIIKKFLKEESVAPLLKDEAGVSKIVGIGIGVAGLIDSNKGVIIESPNIPAINGLNIKETFQNEFSIPVTVDNDANTCTYGERWVGAGKNFNSFIVLTLGTGLGSGYIYNGELFRGSFETGHMVIEPKGRLCTCGNLGCIESYASGRAILESTIASLEKGTKSMLTEFCGSNFYKITPELIYKTALEGDSLCREVFREFGHYLGIGIANLINLLSPDAIIIGGGLVGAWELFIEDLRQEASKLAFDPLYSRVKIVKSTLTEECGSIGAAGLIFKAAG
ncbi:MAG: ROK family protein [Nitrospirae bacterium]|nr:ROK family protein [Nitrospirota bacterium]